MNRIGPSMKVALEYIQLHPGCCAAEVDRAVRTARGGHKWMYDTIKRLVRARLIMRETDGNRKRLYTTHPKVAE